MNEVQLHDAWGVILSTRGSALYGRMRACRYELLQGLQAVWRCRG